MKEKTKYIYAAILGVIMPYFVLMLTGLTEPVFRNAYLSWAFQILLCIAWIIGLLYVEKKVIQPESKVFWPIVLAFFAAPATVFLSYPVEWYITEAYDTVNPWDKEFLAGIQWLVYLWTIYGAEGLWVILRIVSGAVGSKKQNDPANVPIQ